MNKKTSIFLLLTLFLLPVALAQNETNITGNYTSIFGEVANITWMPRFDVDLGFLKCHFYPYETQELTTSKYKAECDYLWNITKEQIYVPLPISMLSEIERIQKTERLYEETKAMLTFFELLTIVLAVVLVSYLIYSEWWIYKW
jgi:hypothetical protein